MLDRRQFIAGSLAGAALPTLAPAWGRADVAPEREPYRVLYSNDTTNITSCVSPWHKKGEAFTPEMLEATVDEVAGTAVDAHLLQPGLCAIPWWPSDVEPLKEQFDWVRERFGLKPDSFARYLLDGGDLIQVFVDRCRQRQQSPLVSFRLNDGHAKASVHLRPGEKATTSVQHAISRFYAEHPEYRLGPDPKDWKQLVQNFAVPAVREHRLALIRELCNRYDLDGLELDFMRHPYLFDQTKTSSDERSGIIGEFVVQVRQLLDRSSRDGRPRRLSVRIPAYVAAHDALGLDVIKLARLGVDVFNVSCFYFTEQQIDWRELRLQGCNADVYCEMTPATYAGPALSSKDGSDNYSFRRTTNEQFYSTAHLALSRDFTGVSLFNFAYYREHGAPERGPFCEPPFEVLKHLADQEWLASQRRQQWFVAHVWDEPYVPGRQLGNRRKPLRVAPGETAKLTFDLAPPSVGWKSAGDTNAGILMVETKQPQAGARWSARWAGNELKSVEPRTEMYRSPHPALAPDVARLAAFEVPLGALSAGHNRLELELEAGEALELLFVQLSLGE